MAEEQTPGVKTVGRYQILEELGRGAMAVVYKGKDPVIGRTVALKTLLFREDNKEMRDLRQALYRDACAAGTLAHPNIVTIYDVIEEAGMTAVAMEFIEGRTLDAIIKEKAPLPLDVALGLFDQIAAGLDYAHTKGIIHRDVKPANIMLTTDGRVKVTDFGVARVTSAGATMTATVVGSPSYMSPEQIRGGKLDGRSDLFSAATVLYEMLTKERPFPGDDIATTLYRIVHELPTPPAEFNPAIGPELTRVFERAMAKDPNERYPTGAELAKAMRYAGGPASGKSTAKISPMAAGATMKIAAGAPVARVEHAAAPASVPAPSQDKSVALIAAVGVAAVLLLGVGGYMLFGRNATQPNRGTTQPVPGTVSAQNNTTTPGPASTAPAAPTAPAEPVATNPPVATQTPPRRGAAANTQTSAGGRGARSGAATQAAPQVQAQAAAPAPTPSVTPAAPTPTPPAPTAAAPPAEPVAPAVATVSVSFDVRGDFYSGMQVTVDGRRVQGDWPVTEPLRVGSHTIVYSWTSGPRQGTSITETVTLTTGPRNGYRIEANPANSTIRLVERN
jgi:hypothetical protein